MHEQDTGFATATQAHRARGGLILMAGLLAMGVALAAHADDTAKRTLTRAQLAGFAIGTGDPALALKVDVQDGKVVSSAPSDMAGANVLALRTGSEGQVMLNLSTRHDVALKFDLYLSTDGETFEYTSTCAVTPGISGFEMWQRPVREFALGNPRVLPEGKMACD